MTYTLPKLRCFARIFATLAAFWLTTLPALADSVLAKFLPEIAISDLVPGADAYGPIRDDMPVAPVLKGGETIGWAFIASDFVGTTG